ncbi:Sensor protein EvgS [subsurface metagenome]
MAGYFTFNFSNRNLWLSPTLKDLFENCIPAETTLTPELLIENTHPDDKQFLEDLFTLPKIQRKKIAGQLRLTQKIKDYKEIKQFQLNGFYNTLAENEPVLTCVLRDITKEVKLQRDLQRNFEKAEEADKMKTIFLLNISHNIRTPMNSILGFAELLSLTDPGPERRKEYIQVIKKQSKNLLHLIDDVVEIAKYESGSMTVTKTLINTNLFIDDVLRDIEIIRSASRKEQVKLKFIPTVKEIEIFTDAGRLHQIFINLINHSLKYTKEGSIEVGYHKPEDNKIEFFVKDTGYGMNKEELRFLFDRFNQIDKDEFDRYNDETGFGLTIAKSIVKLLGGKISADSEPGAGTHFSFSIPYDTQPSQKIEAEEEELSLSSQYKWQDRVILIVEDEEVNGLFLEAVFQETGAQTLYAKNGSQAIELCKSINKIDLILMDIRMPVMNGIRATKEIRKFNTSIPIIAQTALALQEDMEQFLLAGCNDSIIKPIEVEELLFLVNKYFGH